MHDRPQNPSHATPQGWARLRRGLRDESGQALVFVAVALSAIVGFAGLVIDVGQLRYAQAHLQAAADAAAMAGALEYSYCSNVDCSAMQAAAQTALAENGLPGSTLQAQCPTTTGSGLTLTVNNGPCALGTNDPNYHNPHYVEVVVSEAQPTYLARLLGINSTRITARAEATSGNSPFCVQILDPGGITFTDNGSATLTASCGIIVDSSSSQAFIANGNTTINSTAIDIHGGELINGHPTLNPTPVTGVPELPDTLSWLNQYAPSAGSCTYSNEVVQSSTPLTLNPGTYCGGLTINGNSNVTFSPGVYVMTGNMIINGGDTVSGNGVTFYFSSGSLTMNGSSQANLIAPTTGTYAGILYFQNQSDSSEMILNGSTSSAFQGALYLPDANLTINGSGNTAAYTILDAYSLTMNGGVNFTIGNDYSSLPGGSPAKGVTAVLAE
jgi:Putative Flp pilus-assembly TadE/G-like